MLTLLIDVPNHHLCFEFGELDGYQSADSARAARDEGNLARDRFGSISARNQHGQPRLQEENNRHADEQQHVGDQMQNFLEIHLALRHRRAN